MNNQHIVEQGIPDTGLPDGMEWRFWSAHDTLAEAEAVATKLRPYARVIAPNQG